MGSIYKVCLKAKSNIWPEYELEHLRFCKWANFKRVMIAHFSEGPIFMFDVLFFYSDQMLLW